MAASFMTAEVRPCRSLRTCCAPASCEQCDAVVFAGIHACHPVQPALITEEEMNKRSPEACSEAALVHASMCIWMMPEG